jgi:hypothetical protein
VEKPENEETNARDLGMQHPTMTNPGPSTRKFKGAHPNADPETERGVPEPRGEGELEVEQFAKAPGLLAGDGDLRLFFVVHFDHEAGFEPGNNFLDVMYVDEIGAVGTPERVGGESFEEFFQGAVVGGAFDIAGGNGDEPAFDGGEDEIFGVDEKHALLRLDKDLGRLTGRGFGARELRDELLEAFGGAYGGVNFAFGALNGFGDACLVEGLEDIIDGVDVEGLDSVLVEGGGEDDVGDFEFAFNEFFEDAEAVEARHLDVQEDEVRRILFDEVDGFEAVFALAEKIDLREGLEEESEFFASGFLVVDDDGVDGHKERRVLSYKLSVISLKSKAKSEGAEGVASGGREITTREAEKRRMMQRVRGRRRFGYDAGFGGGGKRLWRRRAGEKNCPSLQLRVKRRF